MLSRTKNIGSWIAWPFLLTICCAITAYGFSIERNVLFFNIAYCLLITSLLALERFMPHEKEWLKGDGQTFANIAHTLSSKGTVQGILIFGGTIGLVDLLSDPTHGIWPASWPMILQVILALIVSEFALYWSHRISHEWLPLWRFHAIHHCVTRLWIVNTGRFHFVDSLISIVLSMAIMIALGAPLEVMKWVSAITAFIGMLTHCNVDMRFGPLSMIFNTPGLHRWHHSRDIREGNKNYGENLMIWDQVFGTYFNPDRRPPSNIGIDEFMPGKFTHQIIWPFLTTNQKKRIKATYSH